MPMSAPRSSRFIGGRARSKPAIEVLVYFKTTAARFDAFREKLRELHPYDVPEILAFRAEAGAKDYLSWVAENCRA